MQMTLNGFGRHRGAMLLWALAFALLSVRAGAQTKEVEVGLIAPMSGPWARQGQVMKMAADMAIESVNASGGIRSMGGAKLKLVVFDTGDTVEKEIIVKSATFDSPEAADKALADGLGF